MLRSFVKKIISYIPDSVIDALLVYKYGYTNVFHSQFGEDIVLRHIFDTTNNGFYVDIGAHHPRIFSNTFLLYKRGWSGINIDPIPGMQKLFKERDRDINLNLGVSSTKNTLDYFIFSKGAYNTLDANTAQSLKDKQSYVVQKIHVLPLKEILDTHAQNKNIDFMNIDVEGHELHILRSNDWNTYRPQIIAIEDHDFNISNPTLSPTYMFLTEQNYSLISRIHRTNFFEKK